MEPVTITLSMGGQEITRRFTSDAVAFSDPADLGEKIQDMYDTIHEIIHVT